MSVAAGQVRTQASMSGVDESSRSDCLLVERGTRKRHNSRSSSSSSSSGSSVTFAGHSAGLTRTETKVAVAPRKAVRSKRHRVVAVAVAEDAESKNEVRRREETDTGSKEFSARKKQKAPSITKRAAAAVVVPAVPAGARGSELETYSITWGDQAENHADQNTLLSLPPVDHHPLHVTKGNYSGRRKPSRDLKVIPTDVAPQDLDRPHKKRISASGDTRVKLDKSPLTKKCPGECQEVKFWHKFGRHSSHNDGLRTYCKNCESQRYRARIKRMEVSRLVSPTTELTCSKPTCLVSGKQSVNKFHPDKLRPSGYKAMCKACVQSGLQTLDRALRRLVETSYQNATSRLEKGRIEAGKSTITTKDIKAQWSKQKGMCFYFGTQPMTFVSHAQWKVSLERLDDEKGYHGDNIVLCCQEFNSSAGWHGDKIQRLVGLLRSTDAVDVDALLSSIRTPFSGGYIHLESHGPKKYANGGCADCHAAYQVERNQHPRGFIRQLHSAMKSHSKRRNHGSVISLEELVALVTLQGGRCAYSGVPLVFRSNSDFSASPERLDPAQGYVLGNVAFIIAELNTSSNRKKLAGLVVESEIGSQWTKAKFEMWKMYLLNAHPIASLASVMHAPSYTTGPPFVQI